MTERRIDPEDGTAYTWEEFSEYYANKYKKKAIASYWEECEVVKSKKNRSKAAKKDAEEAVPEPKANAKAKAKPKAAAKKELRPMKSFKVCVCGASGGIGQPLSLLMSMNPSVKELNLFDLSIAMVPPAGVAADLNHIEKKA
eukprot:TRINITY_DN3676_c0_g1_i1.p2 TRINITY_DN3676_c0_g1~~TRINITY_DN3676_c0_g1_i1.p2  ORF type:complete len:142 (-),score=43.57 TRINITY_DN3676_c0_g1_i1:21-446(-)